VGVAPWGGKAQINAIKHDHKWQFSPKNQSIDGWRSTIYSSQFRQQCDRLLLVEDDLTKAGLGFTAKLWSVALLLAMRDDRVLVEVRMVKQGNTTRADGFERPRWCDRAPYTLQCLYEPWTHCQLPPPDANIVRPGGRPLKVAKWPHSEPYVRTGLGRIHRQGMFWHGARSAAGREVSRFLFRPRKWVTSIADCVMNDVGIAPQQYIGVHIRHSVEKQKEGQKLGVQLPALDAYNVLSAALSADLGLKSVFLQTASPVAIESFGTFCRQNSLRLSYTNNSRSENDAWGGWKGGSEMEQAVVAAVNAYIGSQAAVSISPELSLWTLFLGWSFGPSPSAPLTGTSRVCCPRASCGRSHGGSHMIEVVATKDVLRSPLRAMRERCKEHLRKDI
jgi:hypothetical protein